MTILKTVTVVSLVALMGLVSVHAADTQGYKACPEKKSMKADSYKCQKKCQGKYQNKHYGKHYKIKAIMKQLDLTAAQKRALKESRKAMRMQMKAKRKVMRESGGMSQFITEKGVDRAGMLSFATKQMTQRVNARADMMEKILSILTTQQKTKFVRLLKEANR